MRLQHSNADLANAGRRHRLPDCASRFATPPQTPRQFQNCNILDADPANAADDSAPGDAPVTGMRILNHERGSPARTKNYQIGAFARSTKARLLLPRGRVRDCVGTRAGGTRSCGREKEVVVTISYKGKPLKTQRLHIVVDDKVVVENMSTTVLPRFARRQTRNYLKASTLAVGLILHFGPTTTVLSGRATHRPLDDQVGDGL